MSAPHYAIRGGIEGRERLRILARVMRPYTLDLFERVGIPSGSKVLDVACGGGDVTFDLARKVGPNGSVVGIDLDEAKLELARGEAKSLELDNVEFRRCVIGGGQLRGAFDFAYCRFLLTHLRDPLTAVREIRGALKPAEFLSPSTSIAAAVSLIPKPPIYSRGSKTRRRPGYRSTFTQSAHGRWIRQRSHERCASGWPRGRSQIDRANHS